MKSQMMRMFCLLLVVGLTGCGGEPEQSKAAEEEPDPVAIAAIEKLEGEVNYSGTSVSLSNTQVTDAGLEHVKGLTKLWDLDLSNTQVTDAGLEHLKGLTNLVDLRIENTQVTDVGINDLKDTLPNVNTEFWKLFE